MCSHGRLSLCLHGSRIKMVVEVEDEQAHIKPTALFERAKIEICNRLCPRQRVKTAGVLVQRGRPTCNCSQYTTSVCSYTFLATLDIDISHIFGCMISHGRSETTRGPEIFRDAAPPPSSTHDACACDPDTHTVYLLSLKRVSPSNWCSS